MNGKGNTYQELIAYALQSLEENGQLPQTLQELAFASGLSDAEVYECFASIHALNTGLIDQGLVLLTDAIRQGIIQADPTNPVAQLRALSRSYFSWGAQNRGLFRVLANALVSPATAIGSDMEMHRTSIRELVLKKLRESQTMGLIAPEADLHILMANFHSLFLGISTMLTQDHRDSWYTGPISDLELLAHSMMDQFIDHMFAPRVPQKLQR